MSVRHAKHTALPDVPGYEILFSDWNADHVGSPLTATDGTTSVADVTKLTTVGATVTAAGAGEAIVTVAQGIDYVQDTDPGAVGAGKTWIRTDSGMNAASPYRQLYIRDAADTGWISAGLAHYDGTGQLRESLSISDAGLFVMHWNAAGVLVAEFVIRENGAGEAFGIETYIFDGITGLLKTVHSFDVESYAMTIDGTVVNIACGSVDPRAGAGVALAQGSLYMRGTGEQFCKVGAGATDWALIGENSPTADEKAALDSAPTALTALNPVASVADLPTVPVGGTPALALGTANAAGSAATFVKTDATLLAFDAVAPSTQAFGDAAAVGVATVAPRRDHKHAMPAAPSVPTAATTVTGPDSFGASAVVGTGTTFARSDHDHGLPSAPAVPAPSTTVTGPDSFGASAVVGTGTTFARSDHDHGLPAAPAVPTPASTVTGPDAYGASAVVGTSALYARQDHDHGLPAAVSVPSAGASSDIGVEYLAVAAAAGATGKYADAGHVHKLPGRHNAFFM